MILLTFYIFFNSVCGCKCLSRTMSVNLDKTLTLGIERVAEAPDMWLVPAAFKRTYFKRETCSFRI